MSVSARVGEERKREGWKSREERDQNGRGRRKDQEIERDREIKSPVACSFKKLSSASSLCELALALAVLDFLTDLLRFLESTSCCMFGKKNYF